METNINENLTGERETAAGKSEVESPEVRRQNLGRMRLASLYAYGSIPEEEAWKKLTAWAGPKGLLDDPAEHPIFGFNNPEPGDESGEYGYEIWIKVGPEIKPEGEVRIIDFNGGPYAVIRCEVKGEPGLNIPTGWQRLAEWCNQNKREFGYHPALEQFLTGMDDLDKLVLDLYCPIVE